MNNIIIFGYKVTTPDALAEMSRATGKSEQYIRGLQDGKFSASPKAHAKIEKWIAEQVVSGNAVKVSSSCPHCDGESGLYTKRIAYHLFKFDWERNPIPLVDDGARAEWVVCCLDCDERIGNYKDMVTEFQSDE